jgi:hypothetical protein
MYTGEAGDVAAIEPEAFLIVLQAVLKSSFSDDHRFDDRHVKRGAAGRG